MAAAAVAEMPAAGLAALRRALEDLDDARARVLLLQRRHLDAQPFTGRGERHEQHQAFVAGDGEAAERQALGGDFDDLADGERGRHQATNTKNMRRRQLSSGAP